MDCPKCGLNQPDAATECPRCGIVFARFEAAARAEPRVQEAAPVTVAAPAAGAESGVRPIDREGRKALAVGTAIAVVVFAVPFPSFVFSYFVVLVHELGHCVVGWLFGYPSIPAFDFSYGGGVTMHDERQVGIVILVYAALAAGFWLVRGRPRAIVALAGTTVAYSLLAWTPAHEAAIVLGGHGSELVFAGIFLHRAVSGEGLEARAERPAYAFVACFTLLFDVRFALRLIASPLERAIYEEAKGGGHWMDFSRLADEHFHTSLGSVALLFLLACALTPVLAVLAHRYRPRLAIGLARILAPAS